MPKGVLQDRGQRFPNSYEGGPPPGPGGPGGPPGGPPAGYPGWGYQGHPQYRGQVMNPFIVTLMIKVSDMNFQLVN